MSDSPTSSDSSGPSGPSSNPSAGPRMSPPVYAEQVVVAPADAVQRNRLGTTAFVFSLLGLTLLPVLGGVVALICGVIAVKREPRGLAVAAVVISLLGSCIVLPIVAVPLVMLPALSMARTGAATTQAVMSGAQMQAMVESFRAEKNRLPADAAELMAWGRTTAIADGWGNELRLTVIERDGKQIYEISSAGPDSTWETFDDMALYSSDNRQNPSGSASENSPGADLSSRRLAAQRELTESLAVQLDSMLKMFQIENERLPADMNELLAWDGSGYSIRDAWDTDLRLTIGGDAQRPGYSIHSAGPDRIWETADDILLRSFESVTSPPAGSKPDTAPDGDEAASDRT